MFSIKIILTVLITISFLNQLYYLVGAVKEVFWGSTKRYLPFWLYNCYIYTGLATLFAGHYVNAFVWAGIAAFEYYVAHEFIDKRKEESTNLDE